MNPGAMSLKSAILRSVLLQNATFLIAFATGIVIARLLTPREFGNYSVAMALMYVVMALKDFGISSFLISDADGSDGLLRAGYGLSLTLTLVLTTLLFFASWPIATFYESGTLGSVLRIAAFGPLAMSMVLPATVLLSRAMRFDALLVIGILGAAAQSCVSLVLVIAGLGPLALGWGYLAGMIVSAGATLHYCPRMLHLSPSATGWRRMLSFSGTMSATLLVGSTSTSTPQLLIGRLSGVGDAALFARASTIVSLVLGTFFFAVTRPMLRGLAEAERYGEGHGERYGEGQPNDDLASLYLRIVACVTGVAWPAYAALSVWSTPLVTFLYGPNWAAAAAMILPIAIGQSLTLGVTPHYDVLIVKRRQLVLLACESAVLVFTACAVFVALVAGTGIIGAAWALASGGGFFAVLYGVMLQRIVRFRAASLLMVWGRSLLVTLAVLPGLVLLRTAHDIGHVSAPIAFVLSGIAATVLWLAALHVSRHELSRHVQPALSRALAAVLRRPRPANGQPVLEERL